MLVHLVSTNSDNYSTIKFTSSAISKINTSIMYRINSISFISNFSITTKEDYLVIRIQNQDYRIEFQDKGKYEIVYDLNELISNEIEGFNISMNDRGLLVMIYSNQFSIIDASHNVKLLLGLYHSNLPLVSSRPKIIENQNLSPCELIMPSIPYRNYGNVLYLTTRTDMICSVNNKDGNEESLSIAYKTNEILYPGFPVMCKIPSQWSLINSSQLNQLEFTLVDFQFQPIKLHSPLYITLEINPVVSQALQNLES